MLSADRTPMSSIVLQIVSSSMPPRPTIQIQLRRMLVLLEGWGETCARIVPLPPPDRAMR